MIFGDLTSWFLVILNESWKNETCRVIENNTIMDVSLSQKITLKIIKNHQKSSKITKDHEKCFILTWWFLAINHDQSWFPNSSWERYIKTCTELSHPGCLLLQFEALNHVLIIYICRNNGISGGASMFCHKWSGLSLRQGHGQIQGQSLWWFKSKQISSVQVKFSELLTVQLLIITLTGQVHEVGLWHCFTLLIMYKLVLRWGLRVFPDSPKVI